MKDSKGTNLLDKLIILTDFIVLNLMFAIYLHFESNLSFFGGAVSTKLLFLFVNAGMVVGQFFYSNVIYKRHVHLDRIIRQVTMLTLVSAIATFFVIKFSVRVFYIHSPRTIFIPYFYLLLYGAILLSRFCMRYLIKKYRALGRNTRNVLFIGSDNALAPIYEHLMNDMSLGYRVSGYYANNEIIIGGRKTVLEHKGNLDDLSKIISSGTSLGVDDIYCSLCDDQEQLIHDIMSYCDKNVIHFYFIPPFTHIFGFNMKMERLGSSVVFTNHETPLMNPSNRFIKRTFDIAVSSFVCLFLLILIPIIALIIKIQSPGPIFFRQKRTGIGGNDFMCYKFRSMHVNKDADTVQATKNDPRKFAFGNFMRKSNIDELPQFLNVLKGDMSIVGPRPHMLHHTEVYSALIDKYMVRHFAKPGITGWAQVTGFRGETKELWQMEGRVMKDIWYIENWSFWLDISIIFKTALQLVIHDKQAY